MLGLATLVSGLAPLFFNVLAEQASGTLSADHVSLGREPTAPLEEVCKIAGIVRDLKG